MQPPSNVPPTAAKSPVHPASDSTGHEHDVHPIDNRSDMRKFAYVMFHYQRMLACDRKGVQQSLPLTSEELHKLKEAISEAKAGWDSVRKRTVPAEEFFDRFLPRAKAFDAVFATTISSEKRGAILPELVQEHRGAIVFLLPEVPEAVGLTDEQLIHIEKIVDETARQFDWTNISVLEVPKLMRLSAANRKEVEAMLDDSQREKWKKLSGN